MKSIAKRHLLVAVVAGFATTVHTQTSQAGPWFDSLFGRRQPAAYAVGSPIPVNGQIAAYSPGGYPSLGYVPPSYAGLRGVQTLGYGNYASPPTNNAPLFAPGLPQTVVGQLPTAAYDSQWARTPVTYYRPVTAFDPHYGTTVTSLQPCTSYQYQAQRQPVIAPRPLLGEYGMQANRYPSITGPGYNPTGLANTAMYAPFAPYQNIPNAGMPLNGQPSGFAPMSGVGVSSSMPATTMPLTTMTYNPAYSPSPYNQPTYNSSPNNAALSQQVGGQPYPVQQSYYNGQVYNGQNYNGLNYNGQVVVNPAYSTSLPNSTNGNWSNQAIGSGVIPTAAWMPSTNNCPNGICTQPSNQPPVPFIPGATSVTPVGPPTYSSTPNPSNGNGNFVQPTNPNTGFGPPANATSAPGYSNPNTYPYPAPPSNGQILPPGILSPGQIMPPNTNFSDPDSLIRPSLGRSNASINSTPKASGISTPKASDSPIDVQKLPLVAIDRDPNSKSNPSDALSLSKAKSDESSKIQTEAKNVKNDTQDIPQTLAPRSSYGMQPLSAPDDFDSKPRWTPTLLDPEDRTVMERASRSTPNRKPADGRLRLQEDRSPPISAVAIESTKINRDSIQLVSGIESKKSEPVDNGAIQFRPVTTLK